ncbi:thioredoxin fold domain-containing protein [Sulfurimonas sp. HSL1-6]|uniref:thioredoxin family protein n=1 Tax=Thiomicrolovo immobilis TaxID=3131935 RepID=UPI0031F7829F
MRLILPALFLFYGILHADIAWYTGYDEAVRAAKLAHKPLMLFLTKPRCKVRGFMQKDVFTDPEVAAYIETHFIAADIWNDHESLPPKYRVTASPVFTFLDADEDEIIEQVVGGKPPSRFLETLHSVIDDNPQFR